MTDMFLKYRRGRFVDPGDKAVLDDLTRAALIEYSLIDGRLYARASAIGRGLRYNPFKRSRRGAF